MILNKRLLAWLKKELPTLVENQIITEFQAHAITEHYHLAWKSRKKKLRFTLIILIGVILVISLLPIVLHTWTR